MSAFITRNKAFAHLDRLEAWRRGEHPAPVTVEWDLTNRCSLGCESCHFAHTHIAGPWAGKAREFPDGFSNTGGLADRALVVNGLRQMAELGVKGIVWSGGGEPTLHPDWDYIVRIASSRFGLEQGMYTLGAHVNAEKARTVAGALSWVVVSLDECRPEAYGRHKGVIPSRFDAALRGIAEMASAGIRVGVSFLLTERNWRDAHTMVGLAKNNGASYAMLRPAVITSPADPAVPIGNHWITGDVLWWLAELARDPFVECDIDRWQQYGRWAGRLQDRGYDVCHGIKLNCTVTPDGRVWVCPQRRGVEGSMVGDLRAEMFRTMWERYSGEWSDFSKCRAMCRLHLTNQALAPVFQKLEHEAFI